MKRFLLAAAFGSLMGTALAADVGVSVSIGQPGFYGRIVLGNMPPPPVVYGAPMIIQQAPIGMVRQPIYLRVPPGHQKHWDKHCSKYGACGQPVYFVQENWYRNEYAPHYRGDRDRGERGDRGDRRDHGERDEDRGRNGKGHDKNKYKHGRGND